MSFRRGFLTLCTLLVISGFSNVYDVSYDYDESYPISSLQTYDWLPLANRKEDRSDAINFERIQNAITAELASKGLTQSSADPGFLIEIVFGSKRRSRRGRGGAGGYSYKEGFLSIDFIDVDTDSLIWHGTARAALDMKFSPEERERTIKKVVEKIMKNFPPPGAK